MAKTIVRTKRVVRRDWTRAEVKELKQHSKNKTRVKTISKALKSYPRRSETNKPVCSESCSVIAAQKRSELE